MSRRAITIPQKKEIVLRLYRLWIAGDNHSLRLGQLLSVVFEEVEIDMKTGESKHYGCMFGKEDYDLIDELERYWKVKEKN